jgi:hypothetical protein
VNRYLATAALIVGLAIQTAAQDLQEGSVKEEASLVGGRWLHSFTEDDTYHPGDKIAVVQAIVFRADGTVVSNWSQAGPRGSAFWQANFQYKITGPSTYTAYLLDCQDSAGGGVCQSIWSPGHPYQCQFTFQSTAMMDLSCGGQPEHFTRN